MPREIREPERADAHGEDLAGGRHTSTRRIDCGAAPGEEA